MPVEKVRIKFEIPHGTPAAVWLGGHWEQVMLKILFSAAEFCPTAIKPQSVKFSR